MLYGIISGARSGASANILLAAANLGLSGAAPVIPFRPQPNSANLSLSSAAPGLAIVSTARNLQPNAANLSLSSAAPTRVVLIPSPNLAPAAAGLSLAPTSPILFSWTPLNLASLVGWWNADDASTLTDAGSGHCSQWNDKSTNANHVVQATDAKRPIITANAINGRTALAFNGAGPLEKNPTSGLPSIATGLSFGGVAKFSFTNHQVLYDATSSGATNQSSQCILETGTLRVRNNGDDAEAALTAFSDTTNANVFTGTNQVVAPQKLSINGTEFNNATAPATNYAINAVRFGELFQDFNPTTGLIAEIAFCSGVLSDTDRQKLEGYLAWKWGQQAALPGGHPYISGPPTLFAVSRPNLTPSAASLGLSSATPTTSSVAFTQTLNTNDAANGSANYSQRLVCPSIASGGTQIRVTLVASTANTFHLNNVSIGKQTTTYNTVATPVELKFGGVSGFTIAAGQTITSDWASFTSSHGDNLIVVTDYAGSNANSRFTSSGGLRYYLLSVATFNQATPAGSWSSDAFQIAVSRIDVLP
jgi:hypothetical protein